LLSGLIFGIKRVVLTGNILMLAVIWAAVRIGCNRVRFILIEI